MRVLPRGSTALLVELDGLDEVLALYAALLDDPLDGVLDVVPAARTLLVVTDPARTTLSAVADAVRRTEPRRDRLDAGELLEIPCRYDGEDRRGTSHPHVSAVRYPNPGANPQNATVHSPAVCRETSSAASQPTSSAASSRSSPS